jgi:hypothetical protein
MPAPLAANLRGHWLLQAIAQWLRRYFPMVLVMGLLAVASLAAESWMMAFMAGFYIVSGALKLLDMNGFSTAFARYDLIAMRFKPWGLLYPFVELALGFAFLFWVQMGLATIVALLLSIVSMVSAIRVARRQEDVACACLGTGFTFPVGSMSIIEGAGMSVMAAWMLLGGM